MKNKMEEKELLKEYCLGPKEEGKNKSENVERKSCTKCNWKNISWKNIRSLE